MQKVTRSNYEPDDPMLDLTRSIISFNSMIYLPKELLTNTPLKPPADQAQPLPRSRKQRGKLPKTKP